MSAYVLPSDRRLVAFRGGPKDGDMEKLPLQERRIVVMTGPDDTETYDVVDPKLANGMLFANWVSGTDDAA